MKSRSDLRTTPDFSGSTAPLLLPLFDAAVPTDHLTPSRIDGTTIPGGDPPKGFKSFEMLQNAIWLNMGRLRDNWAILITGMWMTAMMAIPFSESRGQSANSDFERIKLLEAGSELTGIALSPDHQTLALSFKNEQPIQLFDWSRQKKVLEIPGGRWSSGSRIQFSATGRYLMAKEIRYTDFSQNRDRSLDVAVFDPKTGEVVKQLSKIKDAAISSDEQSLVTLSADVIDWWSLPAGDHLRSYRFEGAGNALAISPDGQKLALSGRVFSDTYKSQFKKNRKGLKEAVRYKQVIHFLDAQSGSLIGTADAFYDVVYNLAFLPGEPLLFVFQTPDVRIQSENKRLSYVNLIDTQEMKPLRRGYTSRSLYQPDLKVSPDRQYFAIHSKGNRFQEIHLYDYSTGTLEKRFELAQRFFEKSDGEKLINSSRPGFIFLPGGKAILIAIGNQLIQWNFNQTEKP
ncbi:MAG: WD40 repeat domain-containing protein [Marinilabiliales bacterium]|nr:WD40 repeat domain-containing protein [Marinilabiliales bacterium]